MRKLLTALTFVLSFALAQNPFADLFPMAESIDPGRFEIRKVADTATINLGRKVAERWAKRLFDPPTKCTAIEAWTMTAGFLQIEQMADAENGMSIRPNLPDEAAYKVFAITKGSNRYIVAFLVGRYTPSGRITMVRCKVG